MSPSPIDIREQFVSGHNGTTQTEVFLVQLVAPLAILSRDWFVQFVFSESNPLNPWSKFALDFLLLVTPMLLSLTLMSSFVIPLVVSLFGFIILLLVLFLREYYRSKGRPSVQEVINTDISPKLGPTTFFSQIRSMLMIFTCLAILAVDFHVFPRRFAKTETFGLSVMDIGTAAFVFVMGATETIRKSKFGVSDQNTLSSLLVRSLSTFVLMAIGVLRTVILPLLNYQLHVTEYGTHWNFFYTLAVVKVFSILHQFACKGNYSLPLGLVFAVLHEFMLSGLDYKSWILSDAPRDSWISANREGIFSVLGYLTLFCFGYWMGQFVPSARTKLKTYFYAAIKLFGMSCLFLVVQKLPIEFAFGEPSRRLMNLPFIFAMISLLTFAGAASLLVQVIMFTGWAARIISFTCDIPTPCLLVALNRKGYMVFFFLLSNILTGLVNLSMDTISVTNGFVATTIIAAYSIVALAITFYLSEIRRSMSRLEGPKES
ncbi:hypothetical protein L596_023427 [Steinernema carpocapsae]|uniref:Phosphatidylinositol-glycan biosynthesis class W protein n=1 Tax=Steinernema carpocapsae TaxID=34508 RepID=A0A4U5MDN4_STECR|nr:hypothetical protein L596_023427 [Steinernema carpocapsae]